jgi:hypothetical protein
MDGRFYVKDAGNGALLVGAAVGDVLNRGHVYEIREVMGTLQLVDLGLSTIVGDDADRGGVDRLLALSNGRHCIVSSEQPLPASKNDASEIIEE